MEEIKRLILEEKFDQAESLVTFKLEDSSSSSFSVEKCNLLEYRVQIFKALGKFELALKDLSTLSALRSPDDVWVIEERIDCFVQMEEFEQAVMYLDQLIEANPKHYRALNKRGKIKFEVFELFEAAIEDLDRSIQISSEYASAYFNKGRAMEALQKLDQARLCYLKAIDCAKKKPQSLRLEVLAECYFRLARISYTVNDLRQVLSTCDECLLKFEAFKKSLSSNGPKVDGIDPKRFFLLFQEVLILKSTVLLALFKFDLSMNVINEALSLFEPIAKSNIKHDGFFNSCKDCRIRLLLNRVEVTLNSTQSAKSNFETSLKICSEVLSLIDSMNDLNRMDTLKKYKLKTLLFKAYLFFKTQQKSKALEMLKTGLSIDPSNSEFLTAKQDLESEESESESDAICASISRTLKSSNIPITAQILRNALHTQINLKLSQ
jgi:tetratricopeptide (TPR) repeat protein